MNRGRNEAEVVPTVLFWLRTHEGHKNHDLVKQWLAQKEIQMKEDIQAGVFRVKKEHVERVVENVCKGKLLRKPDLVRAVRDAVLKLYGLSDESGEP